MFHIRQGTNFTSTHTVYVTLTHKSCFLPVLPKKTIVPEYEYAPFSNKTFPTCYMYNGLLVLNLVRGGKVGNLMDLFYVLVSILARLVFVLDVIRGVEA